MHEVGTLGECGLHAEHDRQGLVLDVDGLECVLRRDLVAGRDDGDRLADVVDLGDGQARGTRVDHVGSDRPRARQVALRIGEVLAGEDGDDARTPARLTDVDRGDLRVRHRATENSQMQHARQGHVVGPGGATGDEVLVFAAAAGLADLGQQGFWGLGHGGHERAPADEPIAPAAAVTARTMFW